jgi:hypothetical protein
MQEFVIWANDLSWEIWFGDTLLGAEPTQTGAVSVAEAFAQMAVRRGIQSKIAIGRLDGPSIELSVIGPSQKPGKEKLRRSGAEVS